MLVAYWGLSLGDSLSDSSEELPWSDRREASCIYEFQGWEMHAVSHKKLTANHVTYLKLMISALF